MNIEVFKCWPFVNNYQVNRELGTYLSIYQNETQVMHHNNSEVHVSTSTVNK